MKNKRKRPAPKVSNLQDLRSRKTQDLKFKYVSYISGIEDEVAEYGYEKRDLIAYRILTPPAKEDHFVPQVFMPKNVGKLVMLSPDELKTKPNRFKKRRLSEASVSLYDTPEHTSKNANAVYRRYLKDGKDAADKRIKEFGTHIAKVHITPNDGLTTNPDENGHMDFLPYDGVSLSKMVDTSFNYIPIVYEDNE